MDAAAILWAVTVPIVVLAAAYLRWRDSADRGDYVAPGRGSPPAPQSSRNAHSDAVTAPVPPPDPPISATGGTVVPASGGAAADLDEVLRLLARTPIRWPDGTVAPPSASRLAAFVGGRRERALARVRALMPDPPAEAYNPAEHIRVDHGRRIITR